MNEKQRSEPNSTSWTPFPITGVENVVEVGRRKYRQAHLSSPPHRHDAQRLEILCMEKGRQVHTAAGRSYTLTGGDVLVIFPGELHSGGSLKEKGVLYWLILNLPPSGNDFINLRGDPARLLMAALRNLPSRHFVGSRRLRLQLDAVIECVARTAGDPLLAVHLQNRVVSFLLEVIACAGQHHGRTRGAWTTKIMGYIEEHAGFNIRVTDMARHMGLSLAGFDSRFKQEMGMSPVDYVARRKIEVAQDQMLRHPQKRIIDVAMDLGFSSSQYFATVFRRYAGLSPRAFRKRHARAGTSGT